MGCINNPTSTDIGQIISSLLFSFVEALVPVSSNTHGSDYQRARKEFMRNSLNDSSMVAGHIQGWIKQEINSRGELGYWRSPPGYDVGHNTPGLNSPENFRWENSDMNRSRGGKYKR